jgi:type IV secretory pathway VirB10-like protein
MAQGAQAQRVELFARIFAHGVEQLMRGILGLVRRHQQQERIIRVTGGWLRIDPREWREAMPVTVSVGLGTGNRDQILQHLMTIVQLQGTVVQQQGGPKGPLVYAQNVYDALKALQENAGFKQSFFADPSQPPPPSAAPPGGPQPPPPDPGAMQAQAAVQATQIKAQAAVQAVQMKAQADAAAAQQKAGLEAQLAQQKQQHQMMLEQQKQQHEMDLEQQKAQHDLIIARAKVEAEAAVKQREVELKFAAGAYAAGQGGPGPALGNGGVPGL